MQFSYGVGAGFEKRKKPVPFPLPVDELEYMAGDYAEPYKHLYIQMYKFGQRVGEALATKKEDITFEQHGSKEVMVLTSLTEKNKQMPFRVLPCLVDDPLAREFAYWVKEHDRGKLYPKITRQLAYHYISRFGKATFPVMALVPHHGETKKRQWSMEQVTYKMHPHYLRHCCLTHKVLYDRYDLIKLMQYAGWSTPTPAMVYVHLNWRELLNKGDPNE